MNKFILCPYTHTKFQGTPYVYLGCDKKYAKNVSHSAGLSLDFINLYCRENEEFSGWVTLTKSCGSEWRLPGSGSTLEKKVGSYSQEIWIRIRPYTTVFGSSTEYDLVWFILNYFLSIPNCRKKLKITDILNFILPSINRY